MPQAAAELAAPQRPPASPASKDPAGAGGGSTISTSAALSAFAPKGTQAPAAADVVVRACQWYRPGSSPSTSATACMPPSTGRDVAVACPVKGVPSGRISISRHPVAAFPVKAIPASLSGEYATDPTGRILASESI